MYAIETSHLKKLYQTGGKKKGPENSGPWEFYDITVSGVLLPRGRRDGSWPMLQEYVLRRRACLRRS